MKKRILSILLALALLCSLLPASALPVRAETTSGTCGDDLTWTFDPDTGTLTIEGSGEMYNYHDEDDVVDSPWIGLGVINHVIIGDDVTSIGDHAFDDCTSLTSVTIGNSVTSISEGVFEGCTSLTSVTIPDSVTSIGKRAFCWCYSLTSVTIGNSVTSIGSNAFSDCTSLTSVTIPNSVTSIGDYAFSDCTSLTSVTIPNSVTSIGNNAFDSCTSLTSVTIGNSVTSIGKRAFYDCTSLTSVTIPSSVTSIDNMPFGGCNNLTIITVASGNPNYSSDSSGVLFNKNKTELIQCPGGLNGSYSIPFGVTNIGYGAFSMCSSLTSVTIPDSVTSIADGAFSFCRSLTSVEIPNSVTSIVYRAFYGCNSLTSVTIPNSVTSIGDYAFSFCTSLTSVTIPSSVTSIGSYAFDSCTSLTSVMVLNVNCKIKSDNTTLGVAGTTTIYSHAGATAEAYANTYGFSFVAISLCDYGVHSNELVDEQVHTDTEPGWKHWQCADCGAEYTEEIPAGHVYTCTGYELWTGHMQCIYCDAAYDGDASIELTSGVRTDVVIPEGLDCAWVRYTASKTGEHTLSSSSDEDTYCSLFSADGEQLASDNDSGESTNFRLTYSLTAGETYYYQVQFYSNGSGTIPVLLDEPVTSGTCGDNLTWNFDSETSSLTIVGSGEMHDWGRSSDVPWNSLRNEISSVIIGEGVANISVWAFGYCTSLTSVTIPDSVTSIGDFAFEGCSSLTSVTIPDSVTSISYATFENCTSLTSVTIPDSVASIGDWAFYNCSSLTSVTIPDSVIIIGNGSFASCDNLMHITVASGNQNYSSDSFGVLFDKNITELIQCPGGFQGSYLIPDSVTSIGFCSFSGCSSMTSVSIPDGVTSIGKWAFEDCSSLTSVTIPDSVTSVDKSVFYCCSSLTYVTIGNSVTSLDDWTFENCISLTCVTIPSSVTRLGNGVFCRCTSLTSVTIPESVTSIGYSAFLNCTSLTSVTIPESVTSIGYSAFESCTSLTSVTIPSSVTSIGSYAFSDCSADLVIYGFAGSYAETYANENDIPFVALDHTCPDGHSFGEWTSNSDGTHTRVCTVCGATETENCTYTAAVTAPTCTAAGCTTYTCSRCGDTYTADEVAALGHLAGEPVEENRVEPTTTTEGGYDTVVYCTRCGAELSREHTVLPMITVEYFVKNSISLAGDIGVNFYVNLNEVSKDNAKVVFTWGSGTYAKTQENTFSGLTADGDGNYKLSVQVYAKQMTEMIHAELYDGTEKIAEKDYCVADYCRKVLNMPIEELTAVYNGNAAKAEKLVNLCKAMLIYGGTAQMQFGYRTDDLAYEGITYTLEDVGALGTTTFPEGFAEACGIEFWKSSLMLESETSYRMYFSVTDQTKLDNLTVKLGNETLSYTKSGSYIYYSISNIPAKSILSDYTLTFGDQTVTANAGEYIAKALDKGSDDLKETAKALYWYSTAAIAYFAK